MKNFILSFLILLPSLVFGQGQGVSMRSTNGAAYGITPMERVVPTKSLNYGLTNSPYIVAAANGVTNIFGPFTPGTVTSGIQEALNSLNTGFEYGPTAAGGQLSFSSGYFYFTNVLSYSNTFTTEIKLVGAGSLDTKLVYAGNDGMTNCIWFQGRGNTNSGSLNLPIHLIIRDMGFSSINERTNVLLCVTNISLAEIESCNFTSWRIMTNQAVGSAMSIFGTGYTDDNQTLVGLVIGNQNEHATILNNSFFAGLATGMDIWADHWYSSVLKFAFIGHNLNGTTTKRWPTNSAYTLQSAIVRRTGIDSSYDKVHFYECEGGLAFINPSASGNYQFMSEIQWEGCDHGIGAVTTNYASAQFLMDMSDTYAQLSSEGRNWKITGYPTNYAWEGPIALPTNIRRTVWDNPISMTGPVVWTGVATGDGSGLTNLNIGSSITGFETNIFPSGINDVVSPLHTTPPWGRKLFADTIGATQVVLVKVSGGTPNVWLSETEEARIRASASTLINGSLEFTGATNHGTLTNFGRVDVTGDLWVSGKYNGVKVYRALLTQVTSEATSGSLIVGHIYVIAALNAGDDFANVGYVSEGTPFTATGTTPTDWSNGTTVTDKTVSAPTVTVLENSFGGTLVWTYSSAGDYLCTLTSAFTANKTFLRPYNDYDAGSALGIQLRRTGNNTLQMTTGGVDNYLSEYPVEILVYP